MRKIVFFALFVLFPAFAFAQSAIQLNPSSIRQYTTEWDLVITGSNLAGNVDTHVVFTNGRTIEEIDALSASSSQVVVQAPGDLTAEPGTWSITVKAIDATGTRLIGPAILTVTAIVTQAPPEINTPEVVTAEATGPSGANVTWDVSVFSFADPNNPPTAVCTPQSGSLFSLGTHTVSCTATDAYGTGTAQFLCIVTDNVAPVLTVPSDITVSSPDGSPQVVTFTATATDNIDVTVTPTCKPASGFAFPVGVTTVTCTAIDSHANYATGTFKVTVAPEGRPVITVPDDITAEATGPGGAAVSYDVSVNPAEATLVCTPASGSTFALGTTTVNCTATSTTGSSAASFTVTVEDTTPPAITVPAPITAEATGPSGAAVTYTVSASDLVDGSVAVTCAPLSGSTFALDVETQVQCTAKDSRNNVGFAAFSITVVDTTPPTLHMPANFTISADENCSAVVTYPTVTATDAVDGTDSVTCTPASGFTSGLGTTTINCTSTDAHNNVATGSFTATVADTTAPTIQSVSATPSNLWPDNHKMVDVVVAVIAVDNCDSAPVTKILGVTANQPINGPGDGNSAPDYIINDNSLTLQLRAERTQNQDRIYTIVIATTDFSGNMSTASTTVTVSPTNNGSRHFHAAGH